MSESAIYSIERPDSSLLHYYIFRSFLAGPFFFLFLIPLYFRYHTMRYRFDDEGVSMRWGILFRREISLTYARIQDIHLSSNIVERWLGLARIEVQTASGSSSAEMTIEGVKEFEAVRDFLYSRMRGARGDARRKDTSPRSEPAPDGPQTGDLAAILQTAADEVREIHRLLRERGVSR